VTGTIFQKKGDRYNFSKNDSDPFLWKKGDKEKR